MSTRQSSARWCALFSRRVTEHRVPVRVQPSQCWSREVMVKRPQRSQRSGRSTRYLGMDGPHVEYPLQKSSSVGVSCTARGRKNDKWQRLLSPAPNPLQGRRHDSWRDLVLHSSTSCNARNLAKVFLFMAYSGLFYRHIYWQNTTDKHYEMEQAESSRVTSNYADMWGNNMSLLLSL